MLTYVRQDRPSEQTKQIEEAVENENQPRKSWWCLCLYLESVSIGWGQHMHDKFNVLQNYILL